MSLRTMAGKSLRRLISPRQYQYLQSRLKPEYSFLRRSRGVVHVGANSGQERDIYAGFGLRVIWIEPIPEVFETLTRNISGYPNQRALNYLISDEDGKECQFHVANNGGESSSILDLSKHKEMWPDVAFTKTVTLTTATLRTALKKEGVDSSQFDTLVLDTQGAEQRILEGAISLLPAFQFVKVEAPDFEAYEGCCQIDGLSAFMTGQKFREYCREPFSHRPGLGTYFNVVYQKANSVPEDMSA